MCKHACVCDERACVCRLCENLKKRRLLYLVAVYFTHTHTHTYVLCVPRKFNHRPIKAQGEEAV